MRNCFVLALHRTKLADSTAWLLNAITGSRNATVIGPSPVLLRTGCTGNDFLQIYSTDFIRHNFRKNEAINGTPQQTVKIKIK